MKQHLLSTGTIPLAEASPFDPVWGIGLRADDSEAQGPSRWRGKNTPLGGEGETLLEKALSAVRDTCGEGGNARERSFRRSRHPSCK